jgi:hypothetical protein
MESELGVGGGVGVHNLPEEQSTTTTATTTTTVKDVVHPSISKGVVYVDGEQCFDLDYFINLQNQEGAAATEGDNSNIDVDVQVEPPMIANDTNNFFNNWRWPKIFTHVATNPIAADMSFHVGKDRTPVPVIPHVLAWRCESFRSLFADGSEEFVSKVEEFLRDFEPKVFNLFLSVRHTND